MSSVEQDPLDNAGSKPINDAYFLCFSLGIASGRSRIVFHSSLAGASTLVGAAGKREIIGETTHVW